MIVWWSLMVLFIIRISFAYQPILAFISSSVRLYRLFALHKVKLLSTFNYLPSSLRCANLAKQWPANVLLGKPNYRSETGWTCLPNHLQDYLNEVSLFYNSLLLDFYRLWNFEKNSFLKKKRVFFKETNLAKEWQPKSFSLQYRKWIS